MAVFTLDNIVHTYVTDTSNATFEVVAAPGAGKRLAITRLLVSNDAAATAVKTLELKSDTTVKSKVSFNKTELFDFGDQPLLLDENDAFDLTKGTAGDEIYATVWYKTITV